MKKAVQVISYVLALALLVVGGAYTATAAPGYVGPKKCKKCHSKQYKSWKKTKLATTFDRLKAGNSADAKTAKGLDPNKDYTTDAKCIKCHVTGYQKGGFTSASATPALVGITCEACHGPGSDFIPFKKDNKEYQWAEVEALGLKRGKKELCLDCHNNKSDFFTGFNYDNMKKKVHDHKALKYQH